MASSITLPRRWRGAAMRSCVGCQGAGSWPARTGSPVGGPFEGIPQSLPADGDAAAAVAGSVSRVGPGEAGCAEMSVQEPKELAHLGQLAARVIVHDNVAVL